MYLMVALFTEKKRYTLQEADTWLHSGSHEAKNTNAANQM